MSIFWDLMQQSKIEEQEAQTASLEERVQFLETELKKTKALLSKTLIALEEHIDVDIDGDGKKGR
tara:strand:+ start:2308 stop:2502 length:195 start_codon:yes stop_codon:yes gene_type:complete